MLKFNQLKIVSLLLILLLAPFSARGMEQEEPIEKEVTLVASDGSTFNLVPSIAKLSGTIQDYLKDAKEAGIETKEMHIPAAKTNKPFQLLSELASDIQQAINQEKDSDKALDQKIQAPDGHIFAKNLQPIVNAALQNQDPSTLEELLKLTHFLDMPQIENAIASVYTAQANKNRKTYEKKELQKWLEKLDLSSPTKWLLTKHWYLKKAGITNEWSIKDLIATGDKPEINTDGKLNLSFEDLTSLDGLYDIPSIKHVKTLNLEYNQLNALKAGVFNELSALKELRLGGNRLNALEAGIFNGLSALESLRLSSNQLSVLEVGVFDGLSALTHLYLEENELSVLEAGVFNGLSTLKELRLGGNRLNALEVGIFNGLSALENLNLYNNQLTVLEVGVFNELTTLKNLDLEYNELNALKAGVFNELSALQQLQLNNNRLNALEVGIFNELSALETLNLAYNQLNALEVGIFNGLSALQQLQLNNNRLNALEVGIFNGLSALETLNLAYNQLNALEVGIFNGLSALKYLYLSSNQLNALKAEVFNGLSALKELRLGSNQLTEQNKQEIKDKINQIAPGAEINFLAPFNF